MTFKLIVRLFWSRGQNPEVVIDPCNVEEGFWCQRRDSSKSTSWCANRKYHNVFYENVTESICYRTKPPKDALDKSEYYAKCKLCNMQNHAYWQGWPAQPGWPEWPRWLDWQVTGLTRVTELTGMTRMTRLTNAIRLTDSSFDQWGSLLRSSVQEMLAHLKFKNNGDHHDRE